MTSYIEIWRRHVQAKRRYKVIYAPMLGSFVFYGFAKKNDVEGYVQDNACGGQGCQALFLSASFWPPEWLHVQAKI